MIEPIDYYPIFWDELLREADISGEPQHACFFELFSALAADNGDCINLTYTPVRKEGAYQLDGYALDIDRAELHLAVCDFRANPEMESLNQTQITALFRRAERFLEVATTPEYVNRLEETSPAFQAAYPILSHWKSIRRVRIVLFSNARLVARKKSVESKEHGGRTITYNLLDFSRYSTITNSRNGAEPIEIDIAELNGAPLPCLEAHTGDSSYKSFLVVMPGELLAKIYGLYGPRLLEQNVRTFLQARTKVNQGIIMTIQQAPSMFFAYNNGITATASGLVTERLPDGTLGIATVNNLQIVNGGQTTASILYARDKSNSGLDAVFVQMKLSVVEPERVEDIVPNISRYANTQNKINDADFFSSHPFHLAMEKISRRLPAPQKAGALSSSKWFYERARGQYKDRLAAAERRRFEAEFPPTQVIVKTDVAKYEMSFAGSPEVVSQGAQKCFLAFAKVIDKAWTENADDFNDLYFKEMVARAIIFRWLDHTIAKADWYLEDRGYKANIVTYSIAWLVEHLKASGLVLDFLQIWNLQEPDEPLKAALLSCAPIVAREVKKAPPEIKNISEYAKSQACWFRVSKLDVELPDLSGCVVSRDEARQVRREAVAVRRIDNDIELETQLVAMVPRAAEIKSSAQSLRLLTPASDAGLRKLANGNIGLSRTEKKALQDLIDKLREVGATV